MKIALRGYLWRNMRIKELRLENGYSQQQVANAIGVCLSTYRKYENMPGEIPMSKGVALADFYNVKVDYLVNRNKGRIH